MKGREEVETREFVCLLEGESFCVFKEWGERRVMGRNEGLGNLCVCMREK